ncbi:MAG TPA: SIS domain-containing protein [Candidatus Paceibacterota bacterium]|nr:SIS domain-containing protein [Candidatus Paceibacterota bacterium]
MRDAILSIGRQIDRGARAAEGISVPPFRRIISCGMGGSSIPGEILSVVNPDIVVHWDYGLPPNASGGDLVVCTSWSGNTEETISSWKAARDLGLDTLTIVGGGALADLARADGTPLIVLPADNIPPRTATGYMTGALFAALGMRDKLPEVDPAALEPQGEALAARLADRMLAIYTAYPWRKLTGFWKMAYSETTKRQVMVNWFPSGAHTEVVGWEGPYRDMVTPLFIRDAHEDERYAKNFDALLAILARKGYTVETIQLSGNTQVEKVFNNYLLALWTAFHVATALGVDPQATELLDEFKALKAKE